MDVVWLSVCGSAFDKTDSWAARFEPTVPADGAVTVTYRVRATC